MGFLALAFIIIVVISVVGSTFKSHPVAHKHFAAVSKQDDDSFDLSKGKAGLGIASMFFFDEIIDARDLHAGRQHEEKLHHHEDCFADDFELFE